MKYKCKEDVYVSRGRRAFTQGQQYEIAPYPDQDHPEYGEAFVVTNDFDRRHILFLDFLTKNFEPVQ